MQKLIYLIVLGGLGYLGFVVYRDHQGDIRGLLPGEKKVEVAPLEVTEAVPAATPAPPAFVSKIAMPPRPPGEKQFAPVGVFYMLDRVSVTTKDGILALNPGEEVKLIKREGGGKLRVTVGKSDFEVLESQVTNDLELAQEAERKEFHARKLGR